MTKESNSSRFSYSNSNSKESEYFDDKKKNGVVLVRSSYLSSNNINTSNSNNKLDNKTGGEEKSSKRKFNSFQSISTISSSAIENWPSQATTLTNTTSNYNQRHQKHHQQSDSNEEKSISDEETTTTTNRVDPSMILLNLVGDSNSSSKEVGDGVENKAFVSTSFDSEGVRFEEEKNKSASTSTTLTLTMSTNGRKKRDDLPVGVNYEKNIPKRVVLSWKALTIRAEIKTLKQRVVALIKRKTRRYETILHNVRGIVEPGEMLALMGPSGSGKTSLLNALNYSTKGSLKVDGRIMINGCDADATRMAMVSRYIQQEDLFFGTMTVKEHLVFHAMLRMDRNISKEAKMRRVYQVLKEFNLEKRADVKIGIPGRIKGISGGEKRRLAFASEILTDPPLLFCDEPTSGLDSYMAKSIVYYLQKMSRNGKTIVCTIHQPSSEIFAIFDKICILSQTRVAYFGSRENALDFYTNSLRKQCPPLTNPADFYMDVLGVDVNDSDNSRAEILGYCEVFTKSELNRELSSRIENVKPEYFSAPSNYTPYKSNWSDQMYYLIQRCFFNYFRNYKVVFNDLLMVFLTALLGGLIYYKSGSIENNQCTFDQRSAEMVSFAIFYSITVSVIFSMLNAVMVFPLEIPIYYREHSASVYRSDTYYISKLLNELPIYIVLPTLHSIILYNMTRLGCDATNFGVFLFVTILMSNAAYSLGHILSIVSSDANMAVSLAAPTIAIEMLFSGFFLNRALRTPQFLTYTKYISIFNYGYDVLMINQWENIEEVKCEYDLELLCLASGSAILKQTKIEPTNKGLYIIMLVVLGVSFRIIAFVVLWIKGRRHFSLNFLHLFSRLKKRVVLIV